MTNLKTSISLNFKDKYSGALKKIVTLNKKFESSLGSSKLKINSFNTGLDKAKLGLAGYGNKLNQVKAKQKALAGGIAGSVAKIAAVWATIKIGEGFLTAPANVEKFRTTLQILEGSQEKTKKSLAWIGEFAATTPFQLGEVQDAFVKMKAYGIDPIKGDVLRTLGDTAAAMGKDVMQAVEALADAQTGENERLKEFGIKASTVGQQITYEYTDVLTKQNRFVSVNKKNRAEITKTLTAIMKSNYGGVMEKQSATLLGLWSNIKDYYTRFRLMVMGDAGSGGPFEKIKEKVKEFKETLDRLYKDGGMEKFAKIWSEKLLVGVQNVWAAIKAVFQVVKIAYGAITTIAKLAGGFQNLIVVLGAIKLGFVAINIAMWAMSANPIVLIIGAIVAAVALLSYGIYKLFKNWAAVVDKIKQATNAIRTFFGLKNKGEDNEYKKTAGTSRFDTTTRFNYGRAAAIESPNQNNIKAEMDVNITNEGVPEVKNIKSTGKIPLAVKARGSMTSIPC